MNHGVFPALGFIVVGFCIGLVDRIVTAIFRRIKQKRQYRRHSEQLAAGVPLWEIFQDDKR